MCWRKKYPSPTPSAPFLCFFSCWCWRKSSENGVLPFLFSRHRTNRHKTHPTRLQDSCVDGVPIIRRRNQPKRARTAKDDPTVTRRPKSSLPLRHHETKHNSTINFNIADTPVYPCHTEVMAREECPSRAREEEETVARTVRVSRRRRKKEVSKQLTFLSPKIVSPNRDFTPLSIWCV